jgi:uncharacterized zinc-type alcohol dehydrogenase-like protein
LDGKFSAFFIPRPKVFGKQVKFEMLYCGICHSDCHMGLNHWNNANFPFVPGHELLGKVVEVGPEVTKFKVGDTVGVGCFVDSCSDCESCKSGCEQYCYKGMTGTYNAPKVHGKVGGNQDLRTFGGYTGSNVVHEDYVLKIPDDMDKEKTAPILCAGITMYSPLAHWDCLKGGKTVGIAGIGGLGTMGVKLAKAMGNKVVAISTSNKKEAMAKEKGADVFVVSKDADSVKANAATCDIILNTVSADHDLNSYLPLLKKQGTLVQLGGVTKPHELANFPLMLNRWSVAGSLIGGVKECQDCIDFCHAHGIYPDCHTVEAKQIDWAWDQLLGDGGNADGIRYVIDIKKSLTDESFLPAKE